ERVAARAAGRGRCAAVTARRRSLPTVTARGHRRTARGLHQNPDLDPATALAAVATVPAERDALERRLQRRRRGERGAAVATIGRAAAVPSVAAGRGGVAANPARAGRGITALATRRRGATADPANCRAP